MSIKEFYLQSKKYGVRVALNNVFFSFAKKVLRAKEMKVIYKE